MKMIKRLPLVLLLALLSPVTRADCDFDDFPTLESMQLASVAEAMQWNNLPMSVKGFRTEAPLEAVRGFYGKQWEGEVDFTEFGAWQQILHINEDCMMMVQLRTAQGQTQGRLMLVNPPDEELTQRPLGGGVPVPPDAVVVTDMQNQDSHREGQLVMLLYPDAMDAATRWYEAEMVRSGWQLNRRQASQNNATLIYSKGREQLSVVFLRTAGDQTQILLNRMDR
jgi:hypothetical protein